MAEESKPRGRPKGSKSNPSPFPKKPKVQNGGVREGAGRPLGSKNIYSKESVKKLESLGFDPIEMMVYKYTEIQTLLESGEIRVGSGAYAQLMATQANLINNLMQYGYKKVPEKQEIEFENRKPIAIQLTPRKDTSDAT